MGKTVTLKVFSTIEIDVSLLRQALEEEMKFDSDISGPGDDEELEPKKKPTATTKKAPVKKAAAADFDDDEEDDLEEKELAAAKADSDDDEETTESDEDSADEEDEKPAPKKGKKLSVEDVNDACKTKVHSLIDRGIAGPEARARVLGILQKKFKVKSISSLKATQYAEAISAMK